jgi:phosphatidylinositol-bisphosphatase
VGTPAGAAAVAGAAAAFGASRIALLSNSAGLAQYDPDGAEADAGGVSMPDVYVVGLQEMVDLTATNVVMNAQCGKRSKEWLGLLEGVLNRGGGGAGGKEGDRFELLGTRYLVGVFVAVFAKRKYRPFVSGVQDATAAVGIFGVAGNKGAAALRLRLFDTTFCFVAAHLAAHQNAVAQRNADFHGINGKIEFRDGGAGAAGSVIVLSCATMPCTRT